METTGVKLEHGDSGALHGTSSSCSSLSGALSDDSSEKTLSSYPFLGSAEDEFIQAGLNLTSVSELTQAVDRCKEMVLETAEYSEERKWLVRYLIELRLRLEDARDAEADQRKLEPIGTPNLSPSKDSLMTNGSDSKRARDKRIILGHHLILQAPSRNIMKCDRCCGNVWGVLHLWYKCSDCQYKCHMKCIEKIQRQCAFVQMCETPFYSNDICPEIGLAAQEYRCFECKMLISHTILQGMFYFAWPFSSESSWSEPRQCDYDGRYYCSKCHWDNVSVIPARVVHNWDFSERKVCCNCFSFFRLMLNRPVLNLDALNPQLFQFLEDLAAVKKFRSQFLLIKQYLTRCPEGLKEKNRKNLIWSLSSHLIESPSGLFSLQDLINIHSKTILPILQDMVFTSADHIRSCLVCREKGYFCELCPPRKKNDDGSNNTQTLKGDDILFPFDDPLLVFVCSKCSAVYHRECWMKKSLSNCPRCERLQERRSLLHEPID